MLDTELREAMHRRTILLVGPGELEPEVALRYGGCCMPACDEDPQSGVAMRSEITDPCLQRAELLPGAARQEPDGLSCPLGGAHTRRNASNSAVVSSSSAITSQ